MDMGMANDISVHDLVTRANRFLANGDRKAARAAAQQAYHMAKNDPDVLVLVSKVIDSPSKQLNVLQRALQADPTHCEARELYNVAIHSSSIAVPVVTAKSPQKMPRPAPPTPSAFMPSQPIQRSSQHWSLAASVGIITVVVLIAFVAVVVFPNLSKNAAAHVLNGQDPCAP